MALDKTIISPSEATEIAQAGFDFVNGLLPFAQMFPMKSNDGDWTVTWTPNLPVVKTRAMQRRALDAEVPHVKSTEQSAEKHTGLLPLSGMGHITEREVTKASKQKSATDYVHDKAEKLFEQMGREAAVTLELERIQAMMDATIKIKEGDDRASELVTYSFGRPTNQQNVVPTTKWSDPKADVFADLKKWVKLMRTARGADHLGGHRCADSQRADAHRVLEGGSGAFTGPPVPHRCREPPSGEFPADRHPLH